ncbi:MAG TPA: carboxypeptidase regulatory-like domain-containing protein [Polyangia bacterium]|nr:carboxypeptidase regulatory-like domain-containing protein [Polyangia bacterium]
MRLLFALAVAGCGSSSTSPMGTPDAGPEGGPPPDVGAMPGMDMGTARSVAGTVKDKAGVPVVGAQVVVAGASMPAIYTDAQGKYSAPVAAPGEAPVVVTRDWFEKLETKVTVGASGVTPLDLTLEEKPLKIEPADKALADSYAATFDWTKATLSISTVPRPTRRDFDNAVYFHNPALYRDTSKTPPLTPTPAPVFEAGAAKNFTFKILSGPKMGTEVLDLATVADAIKDTPLGPTEPTEFMMWTPMINWLIDWDVSKAADLRAVGTAIQQQSWGGNAVRPQDLEKVFLDATGNLWVKIVFAGFVQLDPSIKDDDGDGQKEIYAKIAVGQYSKEIVDKLTQEYGKTVFGTHGFSKEVTKGLRDLYSMTGAQVERTLGQPFEVTGLGTLVYPTLVLKHMTGHRNVFLVAPGP